jgi:GNAT superfamily N-acetyltransferase
VINASGVSVRPGRERDAQLLRAIRLEALRDTPDAFGETYEECLTWSDEQWVDKAREWNFYLAEIDGRVVGMARGEFHNERPETCWLFAMYVSPDARGGDAARYLVETVSAWAAAQGRDALYLYVSTAVPRARAFYVKMGFVPTGPSVAMHRDPSLVCAEMRRELTDFDFRVRRVPAHVLYDLRRRVLLGDTPEVNEKNALDDLETTLHYGGFLGERVVVSASLFSSPMPTEPGVPAYQLRYMATDYDVQGRGLGARLLNTALQDISLEGDIELWANARITAVPFYLSTGWSVVPHSEHVSAETHIDHVVIRYSLNASSPGR